MYDGEDMTGLTELLEKFLSSLKAKDLHDYRQQIPIFYDFLKSREIGLRDVSKEIIEDYKIYLLGRRGNYGLYFGAFRIHKCLMSLNTFYSWLKNKGIVRDNPLYGLGGPEGIVEELQARIDERHLEFKRRNSSIVSGEKIMAVYREHLRLYYKNVDGRRRFKLAMQAVYDYAAKIGRTIQELEKKDIPGLLEYIADIERYPSLKFASKTLMNYFHVVRVFFQWLHDEGYRDDNLLSDLNRENMLDFITDKQARDAAKSKSRQYSVKEIFKAYGNYLKKLFKHYSDMSHCMIDLKFFLRFILTRNKTLYSVDEADIEAFKKYIMDYEYLPGVYYTATGQASRVHRVKRFYDWFVINGHRKENPLKGFEMLHYRRSIQEQCGNRKRGKRVYDNIPEPFKNAFEGAGKFLRGLGFNEKTIVRHEQGWRYFFSYLEKAGVESLKDVDETVLNAYQLYLPEQTARATARLKRGAISSHLISVKRLFQYLARFKFLPRDPTFCIQLPKMTHCLPTNGMEDSEIRRLIAQINVETSKGIRDRAIVEVLYSTGVRANELRHIKVTDINFQSGLVRINVPKGGENYQRVIPIGRIACMWVQKYINEVRLINNHSSEEYLFIGQDGKKPLHSTAVLMAIKGYLLKAGIKRHIVTHSFRVSCATGMLKGDADIKHVQEQLGHVTIQSTEKYIRLLPKDLKEVHKRTHPREKRAVEENTCKSSQNMSTIKI